MFYFMEMPWTIHTKMMLNASFFLILFVKWKVSSTEEFIEKSKYLINRKIKKKVKENNINTIERV